MDGFPDHPTNHISCKMLHKGPLRLSGMAGQLAQVKSGSEALLPVFHMQVGSGGVKDLGHLKYQQLESYAIARPQLNYPARLKSDPPVIPACIITDA